MLVFRGGLNAPKPSDVANTAAAQGKTPPTVESSHAGTFTIKEHAWQQAYVAALAVREGMTPDQYIQTLNDPAAYQAMFARQKEQLAIAGAGLPGCPTGAYTDAGTTCYFRRFEPYIFGENGQVALLPPLVFAAFNIPIAISELKGDRFTFNAPPTKTQRLLLERAIIVRSQKRVFGSRAGENRNYPMGVNNVLGTTDGPLMKAIGARYNSPIAAKLATIALKLSVNDVLGMMPDIMLFSINFETNPIQPTPSERTQEGGWRAWLSRGGYPLSRVVVTGKEPASDPIAFSFCKSLLCQCQTSGVNQYGIANTPHPSCLSESIDTLIGKTGGGFWPYISIPQDAKRPEVALSLVFNEAAWITKLGEKMASVLKAIAGAMCANQGIAQSAVASAANKEICADASGKACTKGTPGCKCNKPPIEGQIGAGVFNGGMALWCQGWLGENLPDPIESLPVPDPPPPAEDTSKPWWAIVGAGLLLGAGAVAFMGPNKP